MRPCLRDRIGLNCVRSPSRACATFERCAVYFHLFRCLPVLSDPLSLGPPVGIACASRRDSQSFVEARLACSADVAAVSGAVETQWSSASNATIAFPLSNLGTETPYH